MIFTFQQGQFGRRRTAGLAYATWDPANKDTKLDLSNGNKTVTSNATTAGVVRTTSGKSSGSYYNEFVITNFVSTLAAGFVNGSAGTSNWLGQNVNGWGLFGNYATNVRRYNNGAFVAYTLNYATSGVIGLFIDITNGRAWWSYNGSVISGDPVAGTGAMATFTGGTTMYLAGCPYGTSSSGGSITLRTNPAEHSSAPLTGFTAGWV